MKRRKRKGEVLKEGRKEGRKDGKDLKWELINMG